MPEQISFSIEVSIHASAREATGSGRAFFTRLRFQSTPPHGKRRRNCIVQSHRFIVSIHASAREATGSGRAFFTRLRFQSTPPHGRRQCGQESTDRIQRVSIHASAREATFSVVKLTSVLDVFQSTPPHGRRQHYYRHTTGERPVSIHASAREATTLLPAYNWGATCFNPRLRTGGDTALGSVQLR